jgi:predicted phosphodiesterase
MDQRGQPGQRVAVLSDTHGLATPVRAVLAAIDAAGIDEIVVAGDMVNFGPSNDEVVDLLRARGARMVRGNQESELVATYGTPAMAARFASDLRWGLSRWTMEQLGPARRSFLATLPDRLMLDEATVVVHGSPRYVRDAVTAASTDDELAAMFAGEPAAVALAFVGHTHRPVIRDVPATGGAPPRRFVNVGSAGEPMDGDPRSSFVVAQRGSSGAPGDWSAEVRRVPFDVEATVAEYGNGLQQTHPELAELMVRNLRTARSYFGRCVRATHDVPDAEFLPAVRRWLADNP